VTRNAAIAASKAVLEIGARLSTDSMVLKREREHNKGREEVAGEATKKLTRDRASTPRLRPTPSPPFPCTRR
jgi:hypothetical protein